MMGVVFSLIMRISMLVEFGCGISSISMPVRVAVTRPPLSGNWAVLSVDSIMC